MKRTENNTLESIYAPYSTSIPASVKPTLRSVKIVKPSPLKGNAAEPRPVAINSARTIVFAHLPSFSRSTKLIMESTNEYIRISAPD